MRTRDRLAHAFIILGLLNFTAACLKAEERVVEDAVTDADGTSDNDTEGDTESCSSQVTDPGQKGSVAGVARGLYSDTKMVPGTSLPATAFVDQSAGALKFSNWNGSKFVTEVVSGDGAGTFVRLAFLSNKKPMIFWAQGTRVKVAIRSAAVGTSGTWDAGVIDTGVAPRAIEVSVNPLDQVAVVFLTDTATTGRAKFLYCDAPCTSPTSFAVQTTTPYIENTALIAAQTAVGAAWCKVDASTYYPAAVYAVTGAVRYAVCRNSLGNCLSSTNWNTQTVAAVGNLSSKLHIDSSVVGDTPAVVSAAAAGVTPYKMGTTACTATPAAFSAGTQMAATGLGSQWMSFAKDDLGLFHLAANFATTAVRYYNSTTTDPIGAWNTAGTVETVTLAAAHAGGAALDNSTNGFYISYPAAAVPFDLRLARVNDYAISSALAVYSKYVPDLSGNVQLTTAGAQVRNISSASTSRGVPAVAYVDFSIGAATGAKLKYALRDGDASDDAWPWVLIPGTINPLYPSLAFDDADRPWISFFDSGSTRYFLASNSSSDGSGSWSIYEFPSIPGGAASALPAANATAVAMYYSAGVAKPVMIVLNTHAASKAVWASMLDPSTQTWSTTAVVDGLTAGALGAAHLSADFNEAGQISIAYQDLNLTRVRYSQSVNGTSWSAPLNVSSVGAGPGVSVKINPKTSKPALAYYDQSNNAVFYASCSSAFATCGSSGWTESNLQTSAGVSGLTAASGQLLTTSLQFTSAGSPQVLFSQGQAGSGSLMLGTLSGSTWNSASFAAGINGNLPGMAALNFGVAGWNVSTSLNAEGGIVASYIGPGDWLYSQSCGD
jgi:hypothetical protein